MLPITRASLNSFCRTCLKEFEKPKNKQKTSYNIESTPQLTKWLNSSISARIQMSDSDAHSKYLCQQCYSKVRTFHEFREKAYCSMEALKELLAEDLEKSSRKYLQMFCRTCLKKLKPTEGKQHVYETKNVSDWLLACTGLEVGGIECDEYPHHLCMWCFKKLRNFVEFRKTTKQSFEYQETVVGNRPEVVEETVVDLNSSIEASLNDTRKKTTVESIAADCNQEEILCNEVEHIKEDDVDKLLIDELKNEEEPVCEVPDAIAKTKSLIFVKKFPNVLENTIDSEASNDLFIPDTATENLTSNQFVKDADKNSLQDATDNNPEDQKSNCKAKSRKRLKLDKTDNHRHKCDRCEKKFLRIELRDAHIKFAHEGIEKPFQCEHCKYEFRMHHYLARHLRESHGIFMKKSNLGWTREAQGKVTEDELKCMLCLKVFKRKEHLRDHHRTVHLGDRPHKCGSCERSFATRSTLRIHEMTHTGEKPFKCEKCPKRFRQISDWKVHMEIHSENQHLLCSICHRIRESPDDLRAHMEWHAQTDQHQCPKCGKMFKKRSHLNDHDKAVHLKLRPYKCNHCDRSFALAKTCQTHERTHGEERPEVCSICDKRFKQRTVLLQHLKLHQTAKNK